MAFFRSSDDVFVTATTRYMSECTFWCDCLALRQCQLVCELITPGIRRNRTCRSNLNTVKQTSVPPPACAKCGDHRTRVIGQSPQPTITYIRCEKCGHV